MDARWSRLATLVTLLERAMETNSRLDTYVPPQRAGKNITQLAVARVQLQEAVCRQLNRLETRTRHEINRLTAERLQVDLARKKAKHGA